MSELWKMPRVVWLFRHEVSICIAWYPMWELRNVGILHFRTNGWTLGYSCLDVTARVLKLNFNVTFWNMPFQRKHWDER